MAILGRLGRLLVKAGIIPKNVAVGVVIYRNLGFGRGIGNEETNLFSIRSRLGLVGVA